MDRKKGTGDGKAPFNHGDKEARYRKACERLNSDTRCIFGDESNPHCIQLHHVAGRAFDAEIRPLCHNHHARASDAFKDHPAKVEGCTSPLENIGHFLLGLSELLVLAAEDIAGHPFEGLLAYIACKLNEFGNALIEMARTAMLDNSGAIS